MAGNKTLFPRFIMMLFALLLTAQLLFTCAMADDAELEKILPGQWICDDEVEEEGGESRKVETVLTFEKDGKVSLRCNGRDGEGVFTCAGTWTFELVTGGMDRLTLLFTETDNPAKAGSEYRQKRVYQVYAESWMENDTQYTYFILEETGEDGSSPLKDIYGYDSIAMHREQGPNMRVVNCKKDVSLRKERSKSSARLAKVPLGALVLAFPEEGEENGFIRCVYNGRYGYILAEYLEPAE